jgi:hypothetical protein
MNKWMKISVLIASTCVSIFISGLSSADSIDYPNATKVTQTIAVPSYFDPCSSGSNCYWTQLNSAVPKVGIALINPNSGPGSKTDSSYVTQVKSTQKAGASVLGYVYTSYGSRSAASVEADIDKYYSWYKVDGIFFDEVYSNDCGKQSYYQTLNNYVKSKGGKAVTIINPGTNTQECYVNTADILVIFEDTYKNYQKWTPSSWVSKYAASKFWHIVYSTTQAQLSSALQLSSARNAGWIFMTSDGLPNPYDTLPASAYWTTEVNWIG